MIRKVQGLRRDAHAQVRLTESERAMLESMCAQDELAVSAFLRWLVRQEATRRGLWHQSADTVEGGAA